MIRYLIYILLTHIAILVYWAILFKCQLLLDDSYHLNIIMILVLGFLYALILEVVDRDKRLRKWNVFVGMGSVVVISLTLYNGLTYRWPLVLLGLIIGGLALREHLSISTKATATVLPISNRMAQWFVVGLLVGSCVMTYLLELKAFMTGLFFHFLFLACEFQLILFLKEKQNSYEKILRLSYISDLLTSERDEFARVIHDEFLQDLLAVRNFLRLSEPQVDLAQSLLTDLDSKARAIMQFYRTTILEEMPLNASICSIIEDVGRLYPDTRWHSEVSIGLDSGQLTTRPIDRVLCIITKELVNNIYKHSNGSYFIYKLTQEEDKIYLEIESDGADREDLQRIEASQRGVLLLKLLVEKNGGTMTYQLTKHILTTRVVLREDADETIIA